MTRLEEHHHRIAALPCWSGPVHIEPLPGGMTNCNYRVRCQALEYAVRLGDDLPQHGVMRFNEHAAARAAHAAGLSPAVVHAADGVLVTQFIQGQTLQAADVREARRFALVVDLLRRCHDQMVAHLRGPALMFWVFHVIRNYCASLHAMSDNILRAQMPRLEQMAAQLEAAVGPVQIVFAHNDLLAANLIDDGQRLWLLDWDYAGFNSPLFDLANLSANNGFSHDEDRCLLSLYLGAPPARTVWQSFEALRCASLLREVLWAAVSHHTSTVAFDYVAYGLGWLQQLDARWPGAASGPP